MPSYRRGLLLFIDEAEAFLGQRGPGAAVRGPRRRSARAFLGRLHGDSPYEREWGVDLKLQTSPRIGMSEHQRNALNAMLFHTGSQSTNFVMVLVAPDVRAIRTYIFITDSP